MAGLVAAFPAAAKTQARGTSAGKIVFARNGDIWTIAPDGSELRHLTRGKTVDGHPAWSHSRGTIAFLRARRSVEHGRVWLMRADGTHRRRLSYSGPSLSSGTRALAYSTDGHLLAGGCKVTPDLTGKKWAVTVLDLTTGKSRIVCRYSSEGGIESLDWSPNGRRLAATVEYGGGSGLLMIDVAHGLLLKTHEGNHCTGSVSWRPDGRYLLCSVFNGPGSRLWTWLMRTDGSRVKRLGGNQEDPVYSPDGSHYAFVSRNGVLECADADGSHVGTVYAGGGVWQPAWK
jgi:Tol biopolymer transport system component